MEEILQVIVSGSRHNVVRGVWFKVLTVDSPCCLITTPELHTKPKATLTLLPVRKQKSMLFSSSAQDTLTKIDKMKYVEKCKAIRM